MISMILAAVLPTLVGAGPMADWDVVRLALDAPIAGRLSSTFEAVQASVVEGGLKSTLGESGTKVFMAQVTRSPDQRYAVLNLAVDLGHPSCLVVLFDVQKRRILWLDINGEFPDGFPSAEPVTDPMSRVGLYFTKSGKLVEVDFGGSISRVDDMSKLERSRLEQARRDVDLTKEVGPDKALHIDDITVSIAADNELHVLRNGRDLRVGACGFTR